MIGFIVALVIIELALLGLYAYMKPRGGIRSLFIWQNTDLE